MDKNSLFNNSLSLAVGLFKKVVYSRGRSFRARTVFRHSVNGVQILRSQLWDKARVRARPRSSSAIFSLWFELLSFWKLMINIFLHFISNLRTIIIKMNNSLNLTGIVKYEFKITSINFDKNITSITYISHGFFKRNFKDQRPKHFYS